MWFSKPKRIYMDFASATPVLPEALSAATTAAARFSNPGAIHSEGVAAKKCLEDSRFVISQELACKSREVVFVSGGTEANNLAIVGFARKLEQIRRTLKGTHWIVSAIEHPSVLECFAEVERMGATVTEIEPDALGHVSVRAVEKALKPETVFISIGWANHEIGSIQPLSHISRMLKEFEEKHSTEIILHSDASQAPLYISPQVHTLGVDLLSLDSGKLYGPRGIGALYISNRVQLARTMLGGAQERGLRAGTENVALAAGFAEAVKRTSSMRESERRRIRQLRDKLARSIGEMIPDSQVNGDLEFGMPHMLNVSVPGISSEYVTLSLDKEGVAISTKSACREGEEKLSHVVKATGVETWRAANTLRFSLGYSTRDSDVEIAIAKLVRVITAHRTRA